MAKATQQVINTLETLDIVELETIARHLAKLRRQQKRQPPSYERSLLEIIQRRRTRSSLYRVRELTLKRDAETLTVSEQTELIELNEASELFNVERMKALVELAQLQQTDIDTLMRELHLKTSSRA